MAVRFLPPPAESGHTPASDREDLAEVIELRSRLQPATWQGDSRDGNRRDSSGASRSVNGERSGRSDAEAPNPTKRGEPGEERDLRTASGAPVASLFGDRAEVAREADGRLRAGRVVQAGTAPGAHDGRASDAQNETPAAGRAEASPEAESIPNGFEDAVRLLARRARSSGELRKELLALGHDHVEVEEVALECETRLYLDDLGLARVLTENLRARKRASRSQIRLKLRERLLPDGVIEEALGELDDDEEHDLLREAATERARKMGSLDRQTAERRLLGFLARRGWSGERAIRVVREVLDRDAQRSHSVLTSGQGEDTPSSDDSRFQRAPVSSVREMSRAAQVKPGRAAQRSGVRFQ